ncbi:MAG: glycosyltransferase family 4 protein [Desulfobacterales bacterium]|nr:glycosyltransferase family 4 protein [Desulfobacterales bacterium]
MKILLCHNHYQLTGGEDLSFAAEAALLELHGHQVIRFTRHNNAIRQMSLLEVTKRTFWNREVFHCLRDILRQQAPDVMHCTNMFPLLSPAAYYAARAEKVPIVQSLRNYRYCCLNSYFLRDNTICEKCLGRVFPWPGLVHGCYRNNLLASFITAAVMKVYRILGTRKNMIDCFFTPTEFSRNKLIECGIAPELLKTKPNFIDPAPSAGGGKGGYALFVGRLSPEKGVDTLLHAWQSLSSRLPLKIIGDGPMDSQVEAAVQANKNIDWLGPRSHAQVLSYLGEAAMLVMTSIWYETFGRTIIESFAKGTPVVVSRLGAMQDLVVDGKTGRFFEPGNSRDLVAKVDELLDAPTGLIQMRKNARREYEKKYTASTNYSMLMDIYNTAISNHKKKR